MPRCPSWDVGVPALGCAVLPRQRRKPLPQATRRSAGPEMFFPGNTLDQARHSEQGRLCSSSSGLPKKRLESQWKKLNLPSVNPCPSEFQCEASSKIAQTWRDTPTVLLIVIIVLAAMLLFQTWLWTHGSGLGSGPEPGAESTELRCRRHGLGLGAAGKRESLLHEMASLALFLALLGSPAAGCVLVGMEPQRADMDKGRHKGRLLVWVSRVSQSATSSEQKQLSSGHACLLHGSRRRRSPRAAAGMKTIVGDMANMVSAQTCRQAAKSPSKSWQGTAPCSYQDLQVAKSRTCASSPREAVAGRTQQ